MNNFNFYRFLGLEKLTFYFSYLEWLKFFFIKAYDWNLKFLVPTARTMKIFDFDMYMMKKKICSFKRLTWHFIFIDFRTEKLTFLFWYLEWLKFFFIRHMTGNLNFLVPTARRWNFWFWHGIWWNKKFVFSEVDL